MAVVRGYLNLASLQVLFYGALPAHMQLHLLLHIHGSSVLPGSLVYLPAPG